MIYVNNVLLANCNNVPESATSEVCGESCFGCKLVSEEDAEQKMFQRYGLEPIKKPESLNDITFVHFCYFDNSCCVREIVYNHGTAIHAWGVPNWHVEHFMDTYQSHAPEIISSKGYDIYGISFEEIEGFVVGKKDELPSVSLFDVSMATTPIWTMFTCPCGCGANEGWGLWYPARHQALLVPEGECLDTTFNLKGGSKHDQKK